MVDDSFDKSSSYCNPIKNQLIEAALILLPTIKRNYNC